jgi:hypothetical protein
MRDLLWRRYVEVHMKCVIPITKELDERAMNAHGGATFRAIAISSRPRDFLRRRRCHLRPRPKSRAIYVTGPHRSASPAAARAQVPPALRRNRLKLA